MLKWHFDYIKLNAGYYKNSFHCLNVVTRKFKITHVAHSCYSCFVEKNAQVPYLFSLIFHIYFVSTLKKSPLSFKVHVKLLLQYLFISV